MTEATELLPGLIVRAQSGLFEVETRKGLVTAELRGRLKQIRLETDVAALGDRVQVRLLEDGSGVIEVVEEREGVLSRKAPGRESEQVVVANLDQAVFVFSLAEPPPRLRLLDRLLVMAESEAVPALICANKIDLVSRQDAESTFSIYRGIDYPVFLTSAKTGEGIEELRKALVDHISVFAGPSGVGKSTLLNLIQPDLALRTSEISQATGKGTHTTVAPKLVRLEEGGYVADTPGLKAFALWDIEPEELDGYFPEIRPLVKDCAFSDCTHLHEPGCAVLAAVESGAVSPQRHDSYRRMRLGDEGDE